MSKSDKVFYFIAALIVVFCLFVIWTTKAEAREITLVWDQVAEADDYVIFACDLVPDPADDTPPYEKVWSDLYMIGVVSPADLTDPTLPQWTWAESTVDADGNQLSHCFQVYSRMGGIYSNTGSNFATNILPTDTAPLVFPPPVRNLQTF